MPTRVRGKSSLPASFSPKKRRTPKRKVTKAAAPRVPRPKVPRNPNPNNIDLSCSLCPGKPEFSDVSHLVTHLVSQLCSKRQTDLRNAAQSCPIAHVEYTAWEQWCAKYDIITLVNKRNSEVRAKRLVKEIAGKKMVLKKEEVNSNGDDSIDPALKATTTYTTPPRRPRATHPAGNADLVEPSSGTHQLKGHHWPGEYMFDSATLEMQRLRNQPKDGKVLELMIANSRRIESAEISFHQNGEYRATRDVYAPPSPVLDASVPPSREKKRRSVRTPLVRRPRGKFATSSDPNLTKLAPTAHMHDHHQSQVQDQFVNSSAQLGKAFASSGITNGDDEDFKFTIEATGSNDTALAIFRDASGLSPNGTESSLEETRLANNYSFQETARQYEEYVTNRSNQRSTHDWVYNKQLGRYENVERRPQLSGNITPISKPMPFASLGYSQETRDMHLQLQLRKTTYSDLQGHWSSPLHLQRTQSHNPLNNNEARAYARCFMHNGYTSPYSSIHKSAKDDEDLVHAAFNSSFRPLSEVFRSPTPQQGTLNFTNPLNFGKSINAILNNHQPQQGMDPVKYSKLQIAQTEWSQRQQQGSVAPGNTMSFIFQ